MKKVQQGFTLIELMIVVAIIGILAAVAIPQYQEYTVRARVTEGLAAASQAKTAVAESYSNNGAFPTTNGEAGLPDTISTDLVTGVAVGADGKITISFAANDKLGAMKSQSLKLTPTASNGTIKWSCGTASTNYKYVPAECRKAAS